MVNERILTKGRLSCHAVIESWVIPLCCRSLLAIVTPQETPNAFQWLDNPRQ